MIKDSKKCFIYIYDIDTDKFVCMTNLYFEDASLGLRCALLAEELDMKKINVHIIFDDELFIKTLSELCEGYASTYQSASIHLDDELEYCYGKHSVFQYEFDRKKKLEFQQFILTEMDNIRNRI